MKPVIDTNVLLSGALWKGAPARLLDAVLTGQAQGLTSPALLDELNEVLSRPKFAARLARRSETPRTIVARVRQSFSTVRPRAIPAPPGSRDPDDVCVLACALAAGADAIVTGDDDLLALRSCRAIPIPTAAQALRRLGRK